MCAKHVRVRLLVPLSAHWVRKKLKTDACEMLSVPSVSAPTTRSSNSSGVIALEASKGGDAARDRAADN